MSSAFKYANQSRAVPDKEPPERLTEIFGTDPPVKPYWMLNNNIRDHTWIVPLPGRRPGTGTKGRPTQVRSISFILEVSPTSLLTDQANRTILLDIQDTCLYLDLTGRITRPYRFAQIVTEFCDLIYFINERSSDRQILSLEQISDKDIVNYIKEFNVYEDAFIRVLQHILDTYKDKASIDWAYIKYNFLLSRRQLMSLQDRLNHFLRQHHAPFGPANGFRFKREYPNATWDFDIEIDLAPNERSITNRIGMLEMVFAANTVQRHPMRHSPRRACGDGLHLLASYSKTSKTPVIPFPVAIHALSSAIRFIRTYAVGLIDYLRSLDANFLRLASETKLKPSTVRARYARAIHQQAFSCTPVPMSLSPLNIDSISRPSSNYQASDYFRSSMPLAIAFNLYTGAMWILLNAFSATRRLSLTTLPRSCFEQSSLDNLFDIRLLQPKASVRNQLEAIYRPIPGIVFDFGLSFAEAAAYMELRRGITTDDESSYLFNRSMSEKSIRSRLGCPVPIAYAMAPMSNDTIRLCIDRFLDWSQSPLIGDKRWYIAPHQLRRLFAVLYFNTSGGNGLDELSWFLGHENLDVTFHYAEINPSDEWIQEAVMAISRIATTLRRTLHADGQLTELVASSLTARISLEPEQLVERAIREHMRVTGDTVRFRRISDSNVFFYFSKAP